MDYYSIMTSAVEWKAAICLCGSTACRGSFLHYATQHDLQQVLTLNCGPLWRYASLLRACAGIPLSKQDRAVLDRHGTYRCNDIHCTKTLLLHWCSVGGSLYRNEECSFRQASFPLGQEVCGR